MSLSITVGLAERAYPIRIGSGLLGDAAAWDVAGLPDSQVLIVSDSQVAPLHAAPAIRSLERLGCRVRLVSVPEGESSKSADRLLALYREAASAGLDRSGWVVALGGGVVGDLAGFFAATWLRGVRWLQVPTTLLAMVDSSVGGKTAINLPEGKNLVGAFHQPRAVISDLRALETLPPREARCGLAEVVKTAAIADEALFQALEQSVPAFSGSWNSDWETHIARCCRIKSDIVAEDEREKGRRAILNFGHTLGHAIEAVSGYGAWRHGEAVALGMVFAVRLSERVAGLPAADAARILGLLQKAGLPTRIPDGDWDALRGGMARDKKSESGIPRFVLLPRLGAARANCRVDEADLREAWHGGRQ